MNNTYDIIVIGAGPGGIAAAVRSAQLGHQVLLIEKDKIGGTCLNEGCIPTKTLLYSALLFKKARHAGEFGIRADNITCDLDAMQRRKNRIIKQLASGLNQIIASYAITRMRGEACCKDRSTVTVAKPDGSAEDIRFGKCIIAAGSMQCLPPAVFKDKAFMTTNEALAVSTKVSTMVIVGAGSVGMEFSGIFSNLGCRVHLVEMLPDIASSLDCEVAAELKKSFERQGITLHLSSQVTGIEEHAVTIRNRNNECENIPAESVVWAGGRKPHIQGLLLSKAGIDYSADGIMVDDNLMTANKDIYAVGDALGRHMLAYTASAEGAAAAACCAGRKETVDYHGVPYALYTEPNCAWVGLSEKEASEKYGAEHIRTGRFSFLGNSKASILGERQGLIKIISRQDGTMLGVHMLGADACESIAAAADAVRRGMKVRDWRRESFPHPTLVESLFMAGEDCFKNSIDKVKQ